MKKEEKEEYKKLLENSILGVMGFCSAPRPVSEWSSQIHHLLAEIKTAENATSCDPEMREELLDFFYCFKFDFRKALTEQYEKNYFEKSDISEVEKLLKLIENKKIIVKTLRI